MISIDNLTPDTSKELLTVLSFCEDEILDNIPDNTLNKLNELASYSKKDYFINKNKLLKDQEISEECKELLVEIYNSYIENINTKEHMITELYNEE